VRVPSALCGIVGYKPTRDLISTDGVLILSRTMDHVGFHARSVKDVELLVNVLANNVSDSPSSRKSLATLEGSLIGVDTDVALAYQRAVLKLSAAGFDIAKLPM